MKSLIPQPQVTETPGEATENTNRVELLEVGGEEASEGRRKNTNYMTEYMWESVAKRERVIWTQMAYTYFT